MNKDFGLNSFVLSFRRFYPRHLSKELKDTIMKEVNKLDILSKLVSITTDIWMILNQPLRILMLLGKI